MSGHRLCGADVELVSIVAECQLESSCLCSVVELSARSVSIVINLVCGRSVFGNCKTDSTCNLFARRIGSSNMVRVACSAVAYDFSENICSAVLGVLVFFENKDCSTFAHDKSAATCVKGKGSCVLVC